MFGLLKKQKQQKICKDYYFENGKLKMKKKKYIFLFYVTTGLWDGIYLFVRGEQLIFVEILLS